MREMNDKCHRSSIEEWQLLTSFPIVVVGLKLPPTVVMVAITHQKESGIERYLRFVTIVTEWQMWAGALNACADVLDARACTYGVASMRRISIVGRV
jgi:hypothetical protein